MKVCICVLFYLALFVCLRLCVSDWTRTRCVDQASPRLSESLRLSEAGGWLCPLPPWCHIKDVHHHTQPYRRAFVWLCLLSSMLLDTSPGVGPLSNIKCLHVIFEELPAWSLRGWTVTRYLRLQMRTLLSQASASPCCCPWLQLGWCA